MKIVLVEDSPVVRERLIALVSELRDATIVGYAEDAGRARESIEALQPEVVILDIQLSRGNGIKVLREVKRTPHAPVAIMLTNLVSAECRAACREVVAEPLVLSLRPRRTNTGTLTAHFPTAQSDHAEPESALTDYPLQ